MNSSVTISSAVSIFLSFSHMRFALAFHWWVLLFQRRVRMVLVEGRLQGWIRAKAVIQIFTCPDQDFALQDVIEAVRNCGDVASSLVYLRQECEICFSNYPMSKASI